MSKANIFTILIKDLQKEIIFNEQLYQIGEMFRSFIMFIAGINTSHKFVPTEVLQNVTARSPSPARLKSTEVESTESTKIAFGVPFSLVWKSGNDFFDQI